MNQLDLMKELHVPSEKKIVLLVMDGLGGLPGPAGLTELEAAATPNLDKLAAASILGLSTPIAPGITPGSGPGHLGLFGYEPLEHAIGRGVLEALGIGMSLNPRNVAARGNFCTIDPSSGAITDRRAGRIPTSECARLVEKLSVIKKIEDVDIIIRPVKDYRFALVLEGDGLDDKLTETDPQKVGLKTLPVKALQEGSAKSARILNAWIEKAFALLKDEPKANACTLRGIAKDPGLPSYAEVYGLKACAIATYPMYKGLARLVQMDVIEGCDTIEDEVSALKANWAAYDFFFLHVKKTDSAGEDGNFDAKVTVIENVDRVLPEILALKPDVLVITGDHSTPSALKSHSWHELPLLLHANNIVVDACTSFGERACMAGGLGHIRHVDIMPLAMAHADKLTKYGA
ncbi:MAG TPA: 2,3-bisphosphoglycerate-independent phosphoglycerate mutase [Deltaproteobacteria bacterium]|nr:2,3-bisphosphoglycerate-independent phosphoglycerate mutase [Deltaproteobacteria bacterium]